MNEIDFSSISAVFVTTRDANAQKDNIKNLQAVLNKLGLEMLLQTHSAEILERSDGLSLEEIFARTKFVLSLGGDGNYISACRRFVRYGACVFGVHTGHLGFLTDALLCECETALKEIISGEFVAQHIKLLEADFLDESGKTQKRKLAFNDIAILRKNPTSTAHIDAFLDDFCFNSYYGDGVIVASPMGSTAYNLSAGGAILHPSVKAFSLTPICSHSFSQRPMILGDEHEIEFRSKDDVIVMMDGQDHLDLSGFCGVKIRASKEQITLIHRKNRDYFKILKEKLRWGHQ